MGKLKGIILGSIKLGSQESGQPILAKQIKSIFWILHSPPLLTKLTPANPEDKLPISFTHHQNLHHH